MKQCPDVIKNLKKGQVFRAFCANIGIDLGLYAFNEWEQDNGHQYIHCVSVADGPGRPAGQIYMVMLQLLVLKLEGCEHQWKRINLFRTDEFHCTKCPAIRPFDIEKDEAA